MSTQTNGRNGHARQLVDASDGQQYLTGPTSLAPASELQLDANQLALLLEFAKVFRATDTERLTAETIRITFSEED